MSMGYRGVQVLAYITACTNQQQRPPSYAMIADHCGFNSIDAVCHVVRRLERRGYLTRSDTGSRHRKGWRCPVIEVQSTSTM